MVLSAFSESENGSRSETSVRKKRIFIVDDHSVVRRGLVTLINEQSDMEVCGDAESEVDAINLFQSLKPDLVLADWSLKQSDSSTLISSLTRQNPGLPVLVLSIHDEMTHAPAAVAAGARGYIMKREAADKIIKGIQTLLSGEFYLGHRALAEISGTETARFLTGGRVHAADQIFQTDAPRERIEPFASWAVSVVIPVYNSDRTIGKLCEQLVCELRGVARLEILLVDDGSDDASVEVCRRMCERFPGVVQSLELTRNFGEHNAVMAGLNHATGDYCVIMDDDLQNPPSQVKLLLRVAARGFDAVYSSYPERRHPFYRRAGSLLQDWTARLILGKPAGLYLSSFKVLSAPTVRAVRKFKGPKPYLDALIFQITNKIGTAECIHKDRFAGESSYTFIKLFGLWCRLAFGFSIWPLRVLLGLGLWICGFGIWMGSVSTGGEGSVGVVPLWLYRSLLLVFLGVAGEYMGWLLLLSRKPPQYVVKKITGQPRTGVVVGARL